MSIRQIMRKVGWRKGLKTVTLRGMLRYNKNRITIIQAKRVIIPDNQFIQEWHTDQPLNLTPVS